MPIWLVKEMIDIICHTNKQRKKLPSNKSSFILKLTGNKATKRIIFPAFDDEITNISRLLSDSKVHTSQSLSTIFIVES